ncbi:hypothetical protein B0A49_06321 [Cryomyces minteri]|uniref:Uncharacterized protein n=1 Tax=Cryomyces minteri TaxID=331657 RepID=A0A4U0WLK9_9PEZI|nr:hypothetical protein B0A49_06321 [Cryomyces minteri]
MSSTTESPTDALPHNSTWRTTQSSGSSSSSSASKYNLDENDTRNIVVYKHCGGLEIQSQKDLAQTLDKDLSLRLTRKPIHRLDSCVEVLTEDLWNAHEQSLYHNYPNAKSSLASVCLPSKVYWSRLLLGQYPELYIVSPERSPETSPNASQESSRSNTFDPASST